jgi:predicted phosphoadenosine phosphosulfate sulfurtransferase
VLKRPIGITVLEASRQRIEWTFDHFERVYCSFSAGKDSTIMLHLVADEAKKRGRKFGVLLVDLEGQYKITMEHAQKCVEMYRNLIDLHWVCLPIHLRNAVSVYEPFWFAGMKQLRMHGLGNRLISQLHRLCFIRSFRPGWSLKSLSLNLASGILREDHALASSELGRTKA